MNVDWLVYLTDSRHSWLFNYIVHTTLWSAVLTAQHSLQMFIDPAFWCYVEPHGQWFRMPRQYYGRTWTSYHLQWAGSVHSNHTMSTKVLLLIQRGMPKGLVINELASLISLGTLLLVMPSNMHSLGSPFWKQLHGNPPLLQFPIAPPPPTAMVKMFLKYFHLVYHFAEKSTNMARPIGKVLLLAALCRPYTEFPIERPRRIPHGV